MTGNRGGPMAPRGRGGGSSFIGGGSSGPRGGGGGSGPLRGHGSRGNFANNHNNRRGGGSFTAGAGGGGSGGGGYPHQSQSFRGRGQGHSGRGGRHDGGGGGTGAPFTARDGPMASSFGSSVGKKDENRRTLTDFKIVGLEIRDLSWTWGALPSSAALKTEVKGETSVGPEVLDAQAVVKDEVMEDDMALKTETLGVQSEESTQVVDDVAHTAEAVAPAVLEPKQEDPVAFGLRTTSHFSLDSPPPSRIRIYFHTPVTADDSRPIPHNSSPTFSFGVTPSDSRKGKRKKLEDDDGDLEEGRAPPPPPQMGGGMSDDRSSVAASVAPSVAETASEADWLMAAITEDQEEAEAEDELQPDDEDEDGDQLHVSEMVENHDDDHAHDDSAEILVDGATEHENNGESDYNALRHRPLVWKTLLSTLVARRTPQGAHC